MLDLEDSPARYLRTQRGVVTLACHVGAGNGILVRRDLWTVQGGARTAR